MEPCLPSTFYEKGFKSLWCHLILFLPIISLLLFLFLPFGIALPLYILVLAASALIYYKIIEAMRLPVQTGSEEMIGKEGRAITEINPEGIIRFQNELWMALSKEKIPQGERVRIVAIKGMKVVVEKAY